MGKNLPEPAVLDLSDYNSDELDGQRPFAFMQKQDIEELERPTTPDFARLVREALDRAGKDFKNKLEAQGERIFPVIRENDFLSLETDYGAPSAGLSFFRNLIHPTRSFRYEPVHTVEGVYKTHVHQAASIGRALKRRGFGVFDKIEEANYVSQIYFTDGGVTRAFNDIAETILKAYEDIQIVKKEFGMANRAAFLLPVPTYGLFHWRLEEMLKGRNAEIHYIRRSENGAVDQNSLNAALHRCREENIRPLAYYDCNPHNPTGYVRGKSETEDIAAILYEEGNRAIEKDINFLCARINSMERYQTGRWMATLESPLGGIVMIDDMAYEDLQYNPKEKPHSFGQVSYMKAQYSAVLKGVSKMGLPGLRAGMAIGHAGLIEPVSSKQLMQNFAASSLGVDILAARYGDSSLRGKFTSHARALRQKHRQKAGMIEAFFHGIHNTQKLNESQKDGLVSLYAAHAGVPKQDSAHILSQGLYPFFLGANINGGFFATINCESMRGQMIYAQFENAPYPTPLYLHNSHYLFWVFRSFGMKVVTGAGQGLPENALVARVSFSLQDSDLLRFYDSMRTMRTYFFGESPQRQLDLFQKNYEPPAP